LSFVTTFRKGFGNLSSEQRYVMLDKVHCQFYVMNLGYCIMFYWTHTKTLFHFLSLSSVSGWETMSRRPQRNRMPVFHTVRSWKDWKECWFRNLVCWISG